jgi:biopolymer transport protein ExbD
MAGIDAGTQKGRRRSLDSEINMIPMIDLLMVTVSFLLLTAVWSTQGRLEANANVPQQNIEPTRAPEPERRVHLELRVGKPIVMSVRIGETILESHEIEHDQIERTVRAEWNAHGSHRDLRDPKHDTVVLHAENAVVQSEVIKAMDAVAAIKRGKDPALEVVFASR